MDILVASAFSADSRFAHAINTIKMADGFAKLGHKVTVLCRRPLSGAVPLAQLRKDFGIQDNVDVLQLRPTFLGCKLDAHRDFAFQAVSKALRLRPDLAYCRSFVAPAWLSRIGIPVAAESHAHPGSQSAPLRTMASAAAASRAFRAVVTIAPVLRDNFVQLGVPPEKVLILPDAVDLEMFRRPPDYRGRKGDRPRIVYAGHLYDYKGIPTILAAAAMLPECDFVLVGGSGEDIERQAAQAAEMALDNVKLLGLLPHSAVPGQLWEADLLLLPPSARHPSAQWTSPIKLGEYLASGTPVVATRIPALQHWLSDREVAFAEPDNPASLAQAIKGLLRDRAKAAALAKAGAELAEKLSYRARCQRIVEAATSKACLPAQLAKPEQLN